jgi:arsenite methyltransferase
MEELKTILEKAGFTDITIEKKEKSDEIIRSWNFGEGVEKMVFSAYIKARKPAEKLSN